MCWLAVKIGLAKLPQEVKWIQLYGVAILCGIGFTMSLFISSLAFEQTGGQSVVQDRLGILTGTLLSAILGFLLLKSVLPAPAGNNTPMKDDA
jgi:NhaA family Na+:H+ antiporter